MIELLKPDANILSVLDDIRANLPDETVKNVGELVEHNEAGLALEILCSQIFEYEIQLSVEGSARLKEAACLMGMPISQLDGLKN